MQLCMFTATVYSHTEHAAKAYLLSTMKDF